MLLSVPNIIKENKESSKLSHFWSDYFGRVLGPKIPLNSSSPFHPKTHKHKFREILSTNPFKPLTSLPPKNSQQCVNVCTCKVDFSLTKDLEAKYNHLQCLDAGLNLLTQFRSIYVIHMNFTKRQRHRFSINLYSFCSCILQYIVRTYTFETLFWFKLCYYFHIIG